MISPGLPPTVHPDFGYPPGFTPQKPLPNYTPLPKATPTITLTPGTPTITPIVGKPTATKEPGFCDFSSYGIDEYEFPLPDLENLRWEAVEEDGLKGIRLSNFVIPINDVILSPDGPGIALELPETAHFSEGGWEYRLVVIGEPGQTPWLAVDSFYSLYNRYQWLRNNRLIWIDQGKLYTAKADGSEKVHFPIPDQASEVWSNGAYAIVSGEYLWRVNLTSKIASKIEDMGGISYPSANARLTPDQSELLVNSAGTLHQIPLAPTGPVMRYTTLKYPGRGGRIGRPFTIGSNYIHPGEPTYTQEGESQTVLFHRGNPEPIPLSAIIQLENGLIPSSISRSPDGDWVRVSVFNSQSNYSEIYKQYMTYLATVDNLADGRIYPGDNIWGWRQDPPAVFFLSGNRITQVALPSLEAKEIANIDIQKGVMADADRTLIQGEGFFALFSPDGTLLRIVNHPGRVFLRENGQVLLSTTQFSRNDGDCIATSWLDVLQLP